MGEHNGNEVICEMLREQMMQEVIPKYWIVQYEVSDENVSCKFVLPDMTVSGENEKISNYNQYWRIKIYNLLYQMYPNKECINVEILGVDMLSDIGISPMDYELHIKKENQFDKWITEVTSWVKTRIDYAFRPDDWVEYVRKIDELRILANNLVTDTSRMINDVYKKLVCDKKIVDKVQDEIADLNNIVNHDFLLPKCVMDSYCRYREDMASKDDGNSVADTERLMIFEPYREFMKTFRETYDGLVNFYNQFAMLLTCRKDGKSIETLDNPRLSLINLFNACVAMVGFQKEYNRLFAIYSLLPPDFEKKEIENIVTLLNCWNYVYEHTPQRKDILYSARERYKKSTNYYSNMLQLHQENTQCKCIVIENVRYYMVDVDILNGEMPQHGFAQFVLEMREQFSKGRSYASERWNIQTSDITLAFVGCNAGTPFGNAFIIGIYVLLDKNQQELEKVVLPGYIPNELLPVREEFVSLDIDIKKIKDVIGGIRILIKQYNEIRMKLANLENIQGNGLVIYMNDLFEKISDLEEDLVKCNLVKLVEFYKDNHDETILEIMQAFGMFADYLHNFKDKLEKIEDMTEFEELLNIIFAGVVIFEQGI